MNEALTKPVDEDEIRLAFFSMNPDEAPGPDGMSPLFFQTYWHIIHKDVVDAIQSCFHSGFLLKSINETLVTLIPKCDIPTNLTHYRPISLRNALYKAISKILVNRLKPFLNACISKNQAAFVPDRQIFDNVIISREYLHFQKNKRLGKVGRMALKLDMSKAYDKVEWTFLVEIMRKFVRNGLIGL
ncbi:hypothetical protein ACH5RR_008916 [Cinchona calisaya]|uniref:Reverse transcriptase domain-containing protein n=1 Tax=Cinchona calisaya TaxID=153742 RepID=A0ABD3AEH0_9GENT